MFNRDGIINYDLNFVIADLENQEKKYFPMTTKRLFFKLLFYSI